jgi:hypothetical protein
VKIVVAVPYALFADNDSSGTVAVVELTQPSPVEKVVNALPLNPTLPQTFQSPAVNEILVTFAAVFVDKDTPGDLATILSTSSPTLPAAALLFVVVPIIPEVELKLTLVALAAPMVGVTNVGEVVPAKLPVPEEPDNAKFN